MAIKNGDLPAMPTQVNGCDLFGGLTKREMFAMAALQGLLASLSADDNFSPRELAKCAALNAEVLLAELECTK